MYVLLVTTTTFLDAEAALIPLCDGLAPSRAKAVGRDLSAENIMSRVTSKKAAVGMPRRMISALGMRLTTRKVPGSKDVSCSFFDRGTNVNVARGRFGILGLRTVRARLTGLVGKVSKMGSTGMVVGLPRGNVFMGSSSRRTSTSVILGAGPNCRFRRSRVRTLCRLTTGDVPGLPASGVIVAGRFFRCFSLGGGRGSSSRDAFTTRRRVGGRVRHSMRHRIRGVLNALVKRSGIIMSMATSVSFARRGERRGLIAPISRRGVRNVTVDTRGVARAFANGNRKTKKAPTLKKGSRPTKASSCMTAKSSGNSCRQVRRAVGGRMGGVHERVIRDPCGIESLNVRMVIRPPATSSPTSLPRREVGSVARVLKAIIHAAVGGSTTTSTRLASRTVRSGVIISMRPFGNGIRFAGRADTDVP